MFRHKTPWVPLPFSLPIPQKSLAQASVRRFKIMYFTVQTSELLLSNHHDEGF